MGSIIGREQELALVDGFVTGRSGCLACLLLEGDAGIGKSTLWRAGVEMALERGFRVLLSRSAEAERDLPYVGLGDLFEGALAEVLPELTPPRRRALEVAILAEELDGGIDPRVLGVAVRDGIEVLAAAHERLVVAIDDLQWLDPSSAGALSFAFRRLADAAVLLLLARRPAEDSDSLRFEGFLSDEQVERLRVGPLGVDALQRLLQDRIGRAFGRPTLLRIQEASGGNPFYALELAAALRVDVDPTEPLRVPETLEGLVRARLEGLPRGTFEALVLMSALGRAEPTLLRIAGISVDALEPALAANVVERAGGVVDFAHPLIASALYHRLSPHDRRQAHKRLAEVIEEPLGRARHLALSSEGPDGDIANIVEGEASRAKARGAPIVAAELAEHALRLTPRDARDDRLRRAIAAARAHFDAGEARRAQSLAHDLLEEESAGRWRAHALVLLSDIAEDVALRRRALDEASDDPVLQARIHQWLARRVRYTEGLRAAELHAQASLELAEQLEDDALRAGALAAIASIRFRAGEPDALSLGEAAYELATEVGAPEERVKVGFELASQLIHRAQFERARALLESIDREWGERAEWVRREVFWRLGLIEALAGRFVEADDYLDRAREIALQYDQEDPAQTVLAALVAADRGNLRRARELAERGRRLAEAADSTLTLGEVDGVLGVVELWSGNASESAARFAAADEGRRTIGFVEPRFFWWRGEYVEALLELGRIDAAVDVLDSWEAEALRVGRERVVADVTHRRALVASARGDLETASVLLGEALTCYEAVGNEFGRARALLALGVLRRRRRLKRAARDAIEAALAGFEVCGALGWADRARAEMGQIGGRTRAEALTPAELRVATLVAEGRTNREVAAALFLGERTVASHLTHVYAKLGIRSRTQLARRLN